MLMGAGRIVSITIYKLALTQRDGKDNTVSGCLLSKGRGSEYGLESWAQRYAYLSYSVCVCV